LTALLQNKLGPDSLVEDTPLVIHQPWGGADYAPKNFDHKFYGKIPLRTALALSRNVVSVRIMQLVGVDNVIETAREAGITTKLEPNLSLALGSSAVTPYELAGAYATFSRMGVTIKPQVMRRIENNRGQVIEVFESKVDRVFQVEPVARLVDMMQGVVQKGTGTAAKLPDRPVAGKTGTADAGKDIWFVGYTPDLCTATWGGNDENLPITGQHVTGGDVMAKIWKNYMVAYYASHPTPAGEFVKSTKANPEQLAVKKPADKVGGADIKANDSVGTTTGAAAQDKVSTGPEGGSLVPSPEPTPVQATSEPVTAVPLPAPDFRHVDSMPLLAPNVVAPAPAPAPASTNPYSPHIMMNPAVPGHSHPAQGAPSIDPGNGRLYPYNPPSAFQPPTGAAQ
jgi:membrane peptidoglycan carboxypeptidase